MAQTSNTIRIPDQTPRDQTPEERNKYALLTLKMMGVLGLGAALGAPVVGYFLWEVKQLSWSAGGGKYENALPANPVSKAKEQAFYCQEGVQKRYIGCN